MRKKLGIVSLALALPTLVVLMPSMVNAAKHKAAAHKTAASSPSSVHLTSVTTNVHGKAVAATKTSSARLVKHKQAETEDGDDSNLPHSISADAAAKAAAATVSGGTAGKVELEDENGTAVYGVEVTKDGKKFDVKVDANTGKVLKADADDEDEHEGGKGKNEREDDAK